MSSYLSLPDGRPSAHNLTFWFPRSRSQDRGELFKAVSIATNQSATSSMLPPLSILRLTAPFNL
jgi:hypothetical protein